MHAASEEGGFGAEGEAADLAHRQKTEVHQKRAQTPRPICVEGANVMTAAQKRSSSRSCHMSQTCCFLEHRLLALSLLACCKLIPATINNLGNSCKTTTMLYSKYGFFTCRLGIWHFHDNTEAVGMNIFLLMDTFPLCSGQHRSLIKKYVYMEEAHYPRYMRHQC